MDHALIEQSIRWLKAQSREPRCNAARSSSRASISPTAPTSMPARRWDEVRASLEAHLPRDQGRGLAATRRFGVGLRLSARRGARRSASRRRSSELRAFLAGARSLRLHHQRVSLRPVSRHAREGGRLPARLARRPSGCAYTDRTADILAALLPDGIVGSVSHRAGHLQGGRGAAPRCGAHAWPTRWRGTPRTSSRCSAAPGARSCSRSSRSRAASSRRSRRRSRSSTTICIADASAAIVAAARRRLDGEARDGAAPPSRPLLRHLPRRGGVRGPGRRLRALRRGRHPRRQAAALLRAAAAAGRRRDRADALGRSTTASICTRWCERRNGAHHAPCRPRAEPSRRCAPARPAASGACTAMCRCSWR